MTMGSRIRRTLLAGLVAAAVVVPVSAAASPRIPAPVPASFAPSATIQSRYTTNLAALGEASRMARDAGRTGRAEKLRTMATAAPGQKGGAQFLTFDGRGQGRAIEVLGDLGTADRIAVLVPGSDTSLDTYQRFRDGARSLQQRLQREHPAPRWSRGSGTTPRKRSAPRS